MLNMIQKELKKTENINITENGAIGYKSAGSALVDINYQVSSLRNANEDEIIALFDKAYNENHEYAIKWLFFARDIREGLGERRLFRICYKRLYKLNADLFIQNLSNIAEYGRWDDIISFLGIDDAVDQEIAKIIMVQIDNDFINMKNNQPISLLGKWLPSENASSKKTKTLAKKIIKLLDKTPRQYRLILTQLRRYLRVVEAQMCANKWEDIDYEKVPSLANLRYKDAFMRHDSERRSKYLKNVREGGAKLNMQAATPVDVVSRYSLDFGFVTSYDETLELAWKNLKDVMVEDTLVVADGSGSMLTNVGGNITALVVANALAIYTSEHNNGVYKNQYITFSSHPKFVSFDENDSLRDKLKIALKHDECSNTNIEAVFDLILRVALIYKIPQEEMISNILIISDMEFDAAQQSFWGRDSENILTESLFESIQKKYEKAGYKLPKLIFWNVNSRTKTVPLTENELGVVLVSGFSQNVLKMVMTNKYDAYEVLIDIITDERYDRIYV